MAYLFEESDFSLFELYQGKRQDVAPEGFDKLRAVYDKLGEITDALQKLGYTTEINRNPLKQAGRGQPMKYWEYHWARVYPLDSTFCNDCRGKIFIVVGTTSEGLNIHIDSYASKGYECNDVAEKIKNETWEEYNPQEASQLTCDEIAEKVVKYYKDNWVNFTLFGKEFGIKPCIDFINNMEIEKLKDLLVSNYNLILTGAPGTGKTYLAKRIAMAMGCDEDHIGFVQFHPSYDYTDFVEGLRPIKKGDTLGFQRKDGVFKDFCKKAIEGYLSFMKNQIKKQFDDLWESIQKGEIERLTLFSEKESCQMAVDGKNKETIHFSKKDNSKEISNGNDVTLNDIYTIIIDRQINTVERIKKTNPSRDNFGKGGNTPNKWAVCNYILRRINEKSIPPYVFIIDEINRGEISKIFGELFYSIDSGYRGIKGKVDTQYQNLIPKDENDQDFDKTNPDTFRNGFYVPENVYIIGTMNDIDRSVESMDFAMRRRFAWKEITVESRQSMLDDDEAWGGTKKPDQDIISEIKVRMNNLNACIVDRYVDKDSLSKDMKIGLTTAYQIGAAYFLKYGIYDNNNFDELWNNHLVGLLYEYLRGSTNIKAKIDRLYSAYNDTTEH